MSNTEPNYLNTEDTTEEVIRSRLLSHVSDGVDKSEGSYVWDAHAPVAIELVFVRMALQKILELGFAQTTDLEHLIMRAAEHGVYQKSATKATGTVTVTGKPGAIVPAGIKLATEADADLGIESIYFVTTEAATIPASGSIDVPIEAVEGGTAGNVAAGSIVVLAQSRNSITSITNAQATTGGTDDESLESLRSRYLEKVRNPGTSGNKADYEQWATSVDGVGEAHVMALWAGEGTVKVIIIDENKEPANAELVAAVQKFLSVDAGSGDRQAPIGATVTVVPATTVPINVEATVVLEEGTALASVQEAFEKDLAAYLKRLAFKVGTIRYSRICSTLLDEAGVVDYNQITINGKEANVELKDDEVALEGTVTLHVG
ncbi:MAG: baseplate J/gp47 family protein [Veillonellaceae bacterium]|nr:baseplate J/gp47 family protein [Veillonellaceae bacterium]